MPLRGGAGPAGLQQLRELGRSLGASQLPEFPRNTRTSELRGQTKARNGDLSVNSFAEVGFTDS